MKTVRALPIVQETSGPISLRALAGAHGFMPPYPSSNYSGDCQSKLFRPA
ncbi:MAG: hypothetical protein PHY16_15650 [Methylobacter sp.]|nr:hypothetical protein [Methylobacter sp.]